MLRMTFDLWPLLVSLIVAALPGTSIGQEKSDPFSLRLPNDEQLFRPESEAQAKERIRAAAVQDKVRRIEFPPEANVPLVVAHPYDGAPDQLISYPRYRYFGRTRILNHGIIPPAAVLLEREGGSGPRGCRWVR